MNNSTEIIEELKEANQWLPDYDKQTNWYRGYIKQVAIDLINQTK